MATGGLNLSREFFELLKAIGESKSKQEEDRIIAREVTRLKQSMETPASNSGGGNAAANLLVSSKKRAKEFLVRLLYVSMLGHDNSWGLIRAVEMAASSSLYHKRTGYLVCGACLPPDHEFRFMLVNQMQRDLQSSNILECCGGILACSSIITSDMVPAVSAEVTKLLNHDSATVRKKAIICLHRFYQLAPEVVTEEELRGHLEKVLCDKDPSVMGSSLNVMQAMATTNPSSLKHVVPSLVAILKQIGDRRLPADYDYHRLPAPWMQLKLVRILGLLGHADATASQGMYEIIADCMKKADTGINAGYAVVYECVKTIVSIYPNSNLLDAAASAISRFIDSRSHNLKYLGVTGLSMIVEQHPQYAVQHQMAVMECLEDPDETLQRKTLDLLYRMTNPVNVEFITDKLVHFLSGTTDLFLKKVLTDRVCSIAERYAPSNAWYIQSITKLFEVSGDMVKPEVAQNLMSLLAEGTGADDETADIALRQNAVEIYVGILQSHAEVTVLPRILVETMAWVLGEYGYLSAIQSVEQVLDQLCAAVQQSAVPARTRKVLVQAIMKLVAQAGTCPASAAAVMEQFSKSSDVDLQNRCIEFQIFLTHCPELLPEIFPVDASVEDLQVDPNLSFLDEFVQGCLVNGARPYNKPEDDDDDDDDYMASASEGASAFKMTPYEKPQTPAQAMMSMAGVGTGGPINPPGVTLPPGAASGGSTAPQIQPVQSGEPSLNTRHVANVWGRGGLAQTSTTTAPAPSSSGAPGGSWGAPAPSVTPPPSYGVPSSGSFGAPAPAAPPVKTAEQLEKERQAAALFGGIVPGAPPPAPPASTISQRAAAPPPAPAAAPAPPPAPAPEVDLLDMGAWDDTPAAPASAVDFDSPPSTDLMSLAVPTVETVSEDEEIVDSPPAPAPAALSDDPFAAVMGGMEDKPLETLPSMLSQKYEYNGVPMGPLPIDTAKFGQQWGSCPATSPVLVVSSKISTLDQFMDSCAAAGAHKVEAIAVSNEGIVAGMVGPAQMILIHAKLTPQGSGAKIDATIKGTDQALTGSLAMYLQAMMS